MYELVQLTEHDFYIECPAKVGVVKISEDEVVLIDSGSDKDAAKKVLRVLTAQNWKLTAIFNTHSHADHTGGNKFLQEKTSCKIYARGLEADVARTPVFEPIGLYGGLPFKELKNKFLMAQPSQVSCLSEDILPAGMKLLPLPGHCFEMCGFLTADGTAYLADCVSSEETLAKYGIGYLWNPEETLATLSYIKTIDAARFVPSHAAVCTDISTLADLNIRAIEGVISRILDLLSTPMTFETLLQNIFASYGLTMTVQQYALIGSTLRSYLSSLYTSGKVAFGFENNQMVWKLGDVA